MTQFLQASKCQNRNQRGVLRPTFAPGQGRPKAKHPTHATKDKDLDKVDYRVLRRPVGASHRRQGSGGRCGAQGWMKVWGGGGKCNLDLREKTTQKEPKKICKKSTGSVDCILVGLCVKWFFLKVCYFLFWKHADCN